MIIDAKDVRQRREALARRLRIPVCDVFPIRPRAAGAWFLTGDTGIYWVYSAADRAGPVMGAPFDVIWDKDGIKYSVRKGR